jgi:hypothetical protein
MDTPEKHGTQDEDKQNKTTAQYMLDTTKCKQTQTQTTKTRIFRQLTQYKMCLATETKSRICLAF